MLTSVHFCNFRSFVDARMPLRPFTLVLGANGSGKSNLLKFFQMLSQGGSLNMHWTTHVGDYETHRYAELYFLNNDRIEVGSQGGQSSGLRVHARAPLAGQKLPVFNPSPARIAAPEKPAASPVVQGDGSGTCQVLDALKTGDREDLFDKIEAAFKVYVPEVEKLSLKTVGDAKQIQVREHGLKLPLPATELSEGTRLILCLLTILHQEKPPPIVLLEDIDRGLHPRLFEYVAPLIRRVAEDHDINIIATTHNPWLVNYFRDDKEAVVLVEKVDGVSKLIPLPERLKELNDKDGDAEEVPLGELWFSGLLGGTPQSINPRRQP